MVGNYRITSLKINEVSLDTELFFSRTEVVLTNKLQYTITVEFDQEYLHGTDARRKLEEILKKYAHEGYNTNHGNATSEAEYLAELIDKVIDSIDDGYHFEGTFSNNTGKAVFKPSKKSEDPAAYGFKKFEFGGDKLTMTGSGAQGVNIPSVFVFTKI
jgi:hypothetical protein